MKGFIESFRLDVTKLFGVETKQKRKFPKVSIVFRSDKSADTKYFLSLAENYFLNQKVPIVRSAMTVNND